MVKVILDNNPDAVKGRGPLLFITDNGKDIGHIHLKPREPEDIHWGFGDVRRSYLCDAPKEPRFVLYNDDIDGNSSENMEREHNMFVDNTEQMVIREAYHITTQIMGPMYEVSDGEDSIIYRAMYTDEMIVRLKLCLRKEYRLLHDLYDDPPAARTKDDITATKLEIEILNRAIDLIKKGIRQQKEDAERPTETKVSTDTYVPDPNTEFSLT